MSLTISLVGINHKRRLIIKEMVSNSNGVGSKTIEDIKKELVDKMNEFNRQIKDDYWPDCDKKRKGLKLYDAEEQNGECSFYSISIDENNQKKKLFVVDQDQSVGEVMRIRESEGHNFLDDIVVVKALSVFIRSKYGNKSEGQDKGEESARHYEIYLDD